jgi:hypothetical protein
MSMLLRQDDVQGAFRKRGPLQAGDWVPAGFRNSARSMTCTHTFVADFEHGWRPGTHAAVRGAGQGQG